MLLQWIGEHPFLSVILALIGAEVIGRVRLIQINYHGRKNANDKE